MRPAPLLLLAALVLPIPARAADEVLSDDWYIQFENGRKAGWSHRRVTRGAAGTVTETEGRSLLGGPGGWTMVSSSRIAEDAAGRVLSYRTSVDMGMKSGPQVREGTVKGDTVHAVEDGKARTAPYPAGALGPVAFDRAVAKNLAPGTEGTAVLFQPIDAKGEAIAWEVEKSTEVTNVLGRYLWLTRVEKTGADGLPEVLLLGAGGREFAGSNQLGIWQWFLTEESIAKAEGEPAALLAPGLVEPDRALPAGRIPRARFRLSRGGKPVGEVADGGAQTTIAKGKDGSIDVEVHPFELPAGTAIARPQAATEGTRRWLAATPMVELDHPRVKKTSADAVGGLLNSLRTGRVIGLTVRDLVQPAPANVGFATAAEVLSARTGDSSESAVLGVALARAAGLPARLVAGFVHWDASTWRDRPRPRGAFALHFWFEVQVQDGVWFPLDPMRMGDVGEPKGPDDLEWKGGFDATHVAVRVHDLATDRPFTEIAKPVLDFMQGLKIEVLEPAEGGPR